MLPQPLCVWSGAARMVKQFEHFENTREIMMVRLDEETQVARLLAYVTGMVTSNFCCRMNPDCRESDPSLAFASPAPVDQSATSHDRKTIRTSGAGARCVVAIPETILGSYRKLIAQKFDGSKIRVYPGRPTVGREIADLIVRMARENNDSAYDRTAGALKI